MASVSIIIPAYNEANHLPNLLRSINRVMGRNVDVLVVDNGSSDRTAAIAEDFGCRVLWLKAKTFPSVARNAGVKACDSDLLVFLDADIIVTDAWAQEIQQLSSNSEFVEGLCLTGDSYQMSLRPSWIESYWFEPLRTCEKQYINGGNIVVSRRTFEVIGGFDNRLETGEDVDFCDRARQLGVRITFNSALAVHHEGFPQDIAGFFRRERWHGKGDFVSFHHFKRSRVAQVSVAIGLCYLITLLITSFAIYTGSAALSLLALVCLLFVALLCVGASVVKLARRGVMYIAIGSFMYFVYFNARLSSLLSLWASRWIPGIRRSGRFGLYFR